MNFPWTRSKFPFVNWREELLGIFFPNVCQICDAHPATRSEGYVCPSCWSGPRGVRFISEPFCDRCGLPFEGDISHSFVCSNCHDQTLHFRSARAAVRMGEVVEQAIHRYKYNKSLWFEPFLVDLLLRAAGGAITPASYDFIVPIPLHWWKHYQRQYNQAKRLATALSSQTGVPVAKNLLKRVKPTPTQTRLSRKERAENVKGAFALNPKFSVEGLRLLVLDDVLTTGATASACAKVLMDNNAVSVDVWTVARGMLK